MPLRVRVRVRVADGVPLVMLAVKQSVTTTGVVALPGEQGGYTTEVATGPEQSRVAYPSTDAPPPTPHVTRWDAAAPSPGVHAPTCVLSHF